MAADADYLAFVENLESGQPALKSTLGQEPVADTKQKKVVKVTALMREINERQALRAAGRRPASGVLYGQKPTAELAKVCTAGGVRSAWTD